MRLFRISAAPDRIANARYYRVFLDNLRDGKISWRPRDEQWRKTPRTTMPVLGFFNNSPIFVWEMDVMIDSDTSSPVAVVFKLFINSTRDPVGVGSEHVATWVIDKSEPVDTEFDVNILREHLNSFGMNNIQLPFEMESKKSLTTIPDNIRLTKIRNKSGPACALKIWIKKEGVPKRHVIKYQIVNLETGKAGNERNIATQNPQEPLDDIIKIFNERVEQAKANGFVDKDHPLYIPVQANAENFDFLLNRWKKEPVVEMDTEKNRVEDEFIGDEIADIDFGKILSSKKRYKMAQDFGGFYTGNVPDYAVEMLGTPAVDASQIKSMFNRVDDAINLVNRFDS